MKRKNKKKVLNFVLIFFCITSVKGLLNIDNIVSTYMENTTLIKLITGLIIAIVFTYPVVLFTNWIFKKG